MESILQYIYVLTDNPVTLFALMCLASLGNTFFPPVPIELGTVFGGYLAAEGHGALAVIITATALGSTLGNVLVYYLARKYGMALLKRKPFHTVFRNGLYVRSVAWFRKYGIGALFLAKYVPGMHFCAVVAAGVLRLRALKAVPGILGSNIVSFGLFAVLGYAVESHWRKAYAAMAGISTLAAAAAAVILIIVLAFLARRERKSNRAHSSKAHEL